jgi:hypothetical protein
MTPREIKLLVYGLIIIAAVLFFRHWLNERDENQSNAATVDQAQRTGEASVAIAGNSTKALEDKAEVETVIRTERIYIERQQEALRNENPEIMDWSNGVIPVKLRDADRAARIASKRASDLQSGDSTNSSSEKN